MNRVLHSWCPSYSQWTYYLLSMHFTRSVHTLGGWMPTKVKDIWQTHNLQPQFATSNDFQARFWPHWLPYIEATQHFSFHSSLLFDVAFRPQQRTFWFWVLKHLGTPRGQLWHTHEKSKPQVHVKFDPHPFGNPWQAKKQMVNFTRSEIYDSACNQSEAWWENFFEILQGVPKYTIKSLTHIISADKFQCSLLQCQAQTVGFHSTSNYDNSVHNVQLWVAPTIPHSPWSCSRSSKTCYFA